VLLAQLLTGRPLNMTKAAVSRGFSHRR
jgi:hypothetical protein